MGSCPDCSRRWLSEAATAYLRAELQLTNNHAIQSNRTADSWTTPGAPGCPGARRRADHEFRAVGSSARVVDMSPVPFNLLTQPELNSVLHSLSVVRTGSSAPTDCGPSVDIEAADAGAALSST